MGQRTVPYRSRPTTPEPQRRHGTRLTRLAIVLLVFAALTTGVVVLMYLLGVPLGERDKMEYRFSNMVSLRFLRSWPAWVGLGIAVFALGKLVRGRKAGGLIAGAVALGVLSGWTWWEPPAPAYQHLFNLMSPSQDGAFVLEMEKVGPLEPYLRRFPEYLKRSPEDVFGTRVLSNPPGMTVLAGAVAASLPYPVTDEVPESALLNSTDVRPQDVFLMVMRFRLSLVLTAALAASGVFAYLLGRQFLSPAGALVYALLVTINPATANFTPGKDPAQLLTINAMLWLWFSGGRREPWLRSALAGAVLVVGAVFGLIHFWVALAAVVATAWHALAGGGTWRRYAMNRLVPAAVGAVVVVGLVYVAIGWNIPVTLAAVAKRFKEIQYTIHYTRPLWAVIGLPLFLLFVSPAVLALGWLTRPWRVRRASWGVCVFVSTAGVMLATYVVGVTYELPRLWIAFLPLLTLGACADWPLLRARFGHPRLFKPLALIVAVHVAATVVHVSLLDARECEYRMVQQKFFGAPSK